MEEGLRGSDPVDFNAGTAPAWHDSWNDLGAPNVPQPNTTDLGWPPFPPAPLGFDTIGAGTLCSSPDAHSPSYPYPPIGHDTGFGCVSYQTMCFPPFHSSPDAVTCFGAATPCSDKELAQSTPLPPAAPGSSRPDQPTPARATHTLCPAMPNIAASNPRNPSQTPHSNPLKMKRTTDRQAAIPLPGPSSHGEDEGDTNPPPAKKSRTRASRGSSKPKPKPSAAAKPSKMSADPSPNTADSGSAPESQPAQGHTEPLPEPQQEQEQATEEDEQARVRERHNGIGKKYRNKLNVEFESLQAVLAGQGGEDDDSGADGEGSNEGGRDSTEGSNEGSHKGGGDGDGNGSSKRRSGGGRALNKAKLLDMARERIETLTREREALMAERRELLEGLRVKEMEVLQGER